jgi:hypothetical protein
MEPGGASITAVIGVRRTTSVPHLGLNLAPTAAGMPDISVALIRAIIAAAGTDRDEMTALVIDGEPAVVIAPCGHERRAGAAAGIRGLAAAAVAGSLQVTVRKGRVPGHSER